MSRLRLADRRALAAAARRGRERWRDPVERERARRAMDAIAGPGPHLDRLARRHLVRHEQREWGIARPAVFTRVPVRGAHHLRAAYERGRGVIVSFCHHGPFPGMGVTAAEQLGAPVTAVVGEWLVDPPGPEVEERARVWLASYLDAGLRVVTAARSFPQLQARLERGEVVSTAFDWPGGTVTTFLGRPVAMATGTARLAHRTGALVVPAQRRLRRLRPVARFAPALDPAEHDGWEALHRAVAAVHEAWIADDPAALEDPRRPGCWGEAATAAGWGVPPAGTPAAAGPAR